MTGESFAFLPMYDLPPLRAAWDQLWKVTRHEMADAGFDAQADLTRSEELFRAWTDPNLLIGQTCGWPFISMLADRVAAFARFDFALEGLRPGDYQSVFISRDGNDLAKPAELEELLLDPATRIAVNGLDSQSGYRVLGECVSKPVTLNEDHLLLTGSHANSVETVAQGRADFAAIDAVTWRYLEAFDANAAKVNVVGRSRGVPGLPLITSPQYRDNAQLLLTALEKAVAALDKAAAKKLGIRGLVPANAGDYEILKQEPFGRVAFG